MEQKISINKNEFYTRILEKINNEISSKIFEEKLKKVQNIDFNHYSKKITVNKLKKIIKEYKSEERKDIKLKNLLILLPGNPEIVFKICLEILKYDLDALIVIQDFCLGQNTLIIEMINEVIKKNNLKRKIEFKNLLDDSEIIKKSQEYNKVICVGDSNLYNRLKNKITNIELNSYGILEIYSDSDEFEELEQAFFEFCYENEFEIENYSDLNFEDCIRLINKSGYKFCSVLFSKDEIKQKVFKESVNSKYIIINKNPFKEIKFKIF